MADQAIRLEQFANENQKQPYAVVDMISVDC